MGKKKSKSNYEKLLESAGTYSGIDYVETLGQFLESWRKLESYLEGVPWSSMSREGKAKLTSVIDKWVEEKREDVKERIGEKFAMYTPRWRPSYMRVLEYLIEHPYYIEEYPESPREVQEEIAEKLGLSWRTVRDAFWAFRKAGVF